MMEKETIKNIIDFLEKNDNKNKPFKWKLLNNETLTEVEEYSDEDLREMIYPGKIKQGIIRTGINRL
jgi:hypothetical protein